MKEFGLIYSIIETGAIGVIVYLLIKGLKTEIKSLKINVDAQKEIIETMNKRVFETEKISDLYKNLISDFPKTIDDYKSVVTKTKDATILQLKSTVEQNEVLINEMEKLIEDTTQENKKRIKKINLFVLDKENEKFFNTLRILTSNQEFLVQKLIENDNFNEFIKSIGLTQKQLPSEKEFGWFIGTNEMEELNAKSFSYSSSGTFYITYNNELHIGPSLFEYMNKRYQEIN